MHSTILIALLNQVNLGGGKFGKCLGIVTAYSELRSELGNQLATKSKAAGLRYAAPRLRQPCFNHLMCLISSQRYCRCCLYRGAHWRHTLQPRRARHAQGQPAQSRRRGHHCDQRRVRRRRAQERQLLRDRHWGVQLVEVSECCEKTINKKGCRSKSS